jgi:hypothetical protein
MTKEELTKLTDRDLSDVLQEMRRRNWVVAAYAANDVSELIARNDVEYEEVEDWLREHSCELEQALCEGMYRAIEEQFPPQEDD